MLPRETNEALNDQLQLEFASAYLYLGMAAHFAAASLPGFAHWMRLQHEEEELHALKFFDYITQRGGRVALRAIEAPPSEPGEYGSPLEVFERSLEHERLVTERIHGLYARAQEARDYPTLTFLQWFVTEQVEEESTVQEIVDRLRLAGGNSTALLFLDRELAGRAAAPPAAVGG
ncbi:MAG TPA: ferritin [Chloroflexota bacterium]|nr:ferritin [Chloroflexota bacterium]